MYSIVYKPILVDYRLFFLCFLTKLISPQFCFSNIQEMRKTHKDAFLKKHNIKLGFMSAFVKAAAHALTDQPAVNAGKTMQTELHIFFLFCHWNVYFYPILYIPKMCFTAVIDDSTKEIVYRDYVDISVAVATPKVRHWHYNNNLIVLKEKKLNAS